MAEAVAAFPKEIGPEKKKAEKATAKTKTSGDDSWIAAEPKPQWIWRADKTDNTPIYLRHGFTVKGAVKSARLYSTCDNGVTLWINGKEVGTAPDWQKPIIIDDAAGFLTTGVNQISAKASIRGGTPVFVLKMEIETAEGRQQVLSGDDWKLALSGDEGWQQIAFDDAA